MYSWCSAIAGQVTCRSRVSASSGNQLPHQLRPLLLALRRPARGDARRHRRGDVLPQRLAVHPQALGHLAQRPARMPVHKNLGHIDHVERSPCHRPPVVPDGRKVAPSRWPGPPRHARHPHGELRDRGGELRDRQPLRTGELHDRRQRSTQISTQCQGADHGICGTPGGGVRYRGMYKGADGRYRSAGTFGAPRSERWRSPRRRSGTPCRRWRCRSYRRAVDPGIRATRTIEEYAPLFLRHHQVEGSTKDTYADTLRLHVIPFLGGWPAGGDRPDGGAEPISRRWQKGEAVGEHDPAGQGGAPARCSGWRWRTGTWITTCSMR